MTDWKMMELFEREARVLAQLNHPAIPRYLEYFHVDTPQDRSFYIAQQLAPGQSLAVLVQKGWRANEEEVRRLAAQILEILVYLHELTPPVIHRDIKPQNIIRREDGQVFLVDFGAVQDTYHNTFMRGSTVVGTYGYMAPEQFRGQAVPTTDLYGLGATLLFLLTHRSPAELPTDRLKINFRSRVQISEDFADWLEKMLEPDVEDRFPSAKEALAVLRGKRMIRAKSRASVPWKALVVVGVAAVTSVGLLKVNKYPLLSALGLPPVAIYEAAEKGDINTVRHYLKQGVNTNSRDYWGTTPLHVAGSQDVAQLLIAKGADVNAKNNSGETPLHSALKNNTKDVAQLLIAKGADINARNNSGETPLRLAALYNSKDVAQLLIANGADINARNNSGETPLHLALKNNTKDVAQLLIANGADINAKNNSGETPLHLALKSNIKDVAQLLITNGADVNAKNNSAETPLHWAAFYNSKDVAQLLIAKGADVNAKNNSGETPLHWALKDNTKDVAQLLIAKGADVNARNNSGETPLHLATFFNNHKDVAQLLIAKGADINARNNSGETPLHQAASHNNKDVAQLLIAKGADINARNYKAETPLAVRGRGGGSPAAADVAKLLKSRGATE
jgi:ankyrin repeat protein